MDNVVIVQVLAVLLFLFFCFVTYMNTKTWRATHVTFMFLTFAATLAFVVYASMSLKSRSEWQKMDQRLTTQDQKDELRSKELLYGKSTSEVPKPVDTFGLSDWRTELGLAVVDRGRVWRNVVLTDTQKEADDPSVNGAKVTVKVSTRPANVPEGAPFEPNHIAAGTILYAFKDRTPQNSPDFRYVYLGEFQASEANAGDATLVSTMSLSTFDQRLIPGNEPWILYERMPVDSQETFTSLGDVALVLRQNDFVDPAQYPAVLADYQRDGQPATDADPPENVYAKVTFLKEHKIKVDAMAGRSPVIAGTDQFDSSGLALDRRLQQGGEGDVIFKVGDTAEIIFEGYIDPSGAVVQEGAKQLAELQILQVNEKVYRRRLHDYAAEFKHIYNRSNEVRAAIRVAEKEIATLTKEVELAEATTNLKVEEKKKLLEDKAKIVNETEKIAAYAAKLETSYREARTELSRLYRENAALHEQILAANTQLTREIEARSGSPTSAE